MISPEALAAAQAHARKDYPNESCGLLVDGSYLPCFNYASEPRRDFIIATEVWLRLKSEGRRIDAVIHSHPNGPVHPSARDMQGQVDTAVPWIIIPTFEDRFAPPTIWGHETRPLIGRAFVHGVTDCYSIIEDCYGLGKDELAKQGVEWPFPPTKLKSFPRNDGWWEDGDDLYAKGFSQAGFVEVPRGDVRPGDVLLFKIKSQQINHGGVIIAGGMILHHLNARLSRREPAAAWLRAAAIVVRKVEYAA